MKRALRARTIYRKLTLISAAFVMAVSSMTASVPFILSQEAAAVALQDTQRPIVNLSNAYGVVFSAGALMTINAEDETGLSKIVGNVSKSGVAGVYKSHQTTINGSQNGSLVINTTGYDNGMYTLKFNALDSSNNLSETKSFAFRVDNNKPRIEVKGAAWGNAYGPSSIGDGDVFKEVNFKLSDNDMVSRVFVNGVARIITPDSWSDVNNISVGNNGGKYGQNIISVYDQAGNESTYSFFLDNVQPTVTMKDIPESIGSGPYSKLSFKLYDAYKVSKVIINGNTIDLTDSVWSDLNNVSVGSMYGVSGENTIRVFDLVGNDTSLTFTLDSVPPSATFSYSNANGSALTNEAVVVTLSATESISTPIGWTAAQDSQKVFSKTYTTNTKEKIVITDLAGNKSGEIAFEVKRIDKNPPVVSGVGSNTSVNSDVTLTIFDPKYQGYDGFDQSNGLTVNGQKVVTTQGPDKTYTYSLSTEGAYLVVATDKAGNETTHTFVIDKTLPELSIFSPGVNSEQSKQFTVSGSVSDSLSGVKNLTYVITPLIGGFGSQKVSTSLDSSSIIYNTTDNSWAFQTNVLQSGFYAVDVIAEDNAGNFITKTIEVLVDSDGPVIDFAVSGRTLNGTTDDPGREITIQIGSFEKFTINPLSTAWTLTLPQSIPGGLYTIAIESTDSFGNVTSYNRDVTFANLSPSLPIVNTPSSNGDQEQAPEGISVAQTPVILPASINPAAFQQVLGDATTDTSPVNGEANNEAVEGTSAENVLAQAVDGDSNQGRFMGLAWYWWLLILAGVSILGWGIVSSLRKDA